MGFFKMMRDNYIDINKIVNDKKVFKLFRAAESHGGALRFVGGAVRDTLAGIRRDDLDIDLATDLSPEELVEACEENGLKTIPIGIKFGTVGVVIGDKVLEVTSLRRDVCTDGRHAEVVFTTDWDADASRRDLTINAVYADEKGNVFDYYNGIEDLENGKVRFIGVPGQRIREDYLRILRFFRFYSLFGKGDIDKKALQACIDNREGMKSLSIERIRDELGKILLTPNVVKTLKIMFENEILAHFLPESHNLENLQFLIDLVDKYHIPYEPMRRLFILYNPDEKLAENLACRLRLSKKQRELFVRWSVYHPAIEEFYDDNSLRKLLYRFGRDFCFNKLLIEASMTLQEPQNFNEIIHKTNTLEIPVFPLKGKHIIEAGIVNHHKIGEVLDKLEELWIESDFSLNFDELTAQAQILVEAVDKAS